MRKKKSNMIFLSFSSLPYPPPFYPSHICFRITAIPPVKKMYNNRRSRKRARYTHKKYYFAVPVSQIRKKTRQKAATGRKRGRKYAHKKRGEGEDKEASSSAVSSSLFYSPGLVGARRKGGRGRRWKFIAPRSLFVSLNRGGGREAAYKIEW